MCGITGILSQNQIPALKYYKAHKLLNHRGPDDEGFVAGNSSGNPEILSGDKTKGYWKQFKHISEPDLNFNWILGHHRLSIIDLSENGHQPMTDPTARYWIILNGEIYNYRELRKELSVAGINFRSESDTEVALQSFIRWGFECFSRFNGMWAIAIYDILDQKLILCRDRLGIKPLYYHYGKDLFLFASETKFFRPLLVLNVNDNIAAEYILYSQLDHRAETFYKEIDQLQAGHYAVYSFINHSYSTFRYWFPEKIEKKVDIVLNDAINDFEELFSSSIDFRMRSDVPVGCLLSGGLDSTSIVCNLHKRNKFPPGGFHSFTADFIEDKFSEKKFIDETIARCGHILPHFIYPSPQRLEHDVEKLIYTHDFPIRSLSVYSQQLLYQEVRKNSPVIVLLNGQGSDELFAGYTSHYYSYIVSLLSDNRLGEAYRASKWLSEKREIRYIQVLKYLVRSILSNNRFLSNIISDDNYGHFLNKKIGKFTPDFRRDPFSTELMTNLLYSALPEYLRYEDRNSMASSTESRLPFLDYRLVEWAISLPNDLKIYDGKNKRIVRESVASYVPHSILKRTDKMGFVSPQQLWQKSELSKIMKEVIHSNWEIPFLKKSDIINGYNEYSKGANDDWPFWWRIFCYIVWVNLNNSAN